jgi:hypothetical protein
MDDANDDVLELETLDDLTRFFAEFAGPARRRSFDGVEFTTARGNVPGTIPRDVLAVFMPLFSGTQADARRGPQGVFVSLVLPQRVPSDLLLRTQARSTPAEESIETCFHVEASDPAAVAAYLLDGLGEILVRLNRTYLINMTDERLVLGPFHTRPAEFARDVAALIAKLPRPPADASLVPDFDEASAVGGVVEVARAGGRINATISCGALEAAGIPCRLRGSTGGGMLAAASIDDEVRIVVPASFADQARLVLEGIEGPRGGAENREDST